MAKENSEDNPLGIKVASKEGAAWTQIKEGAEKEIEQMKRMIICNEAIVARANEMIEKEQ